MSHGIEEARAALVPWFKERAKDNEILGEPILVMLFVEMGNAERSSMAPVFSERFDPKVMRAELFADIVLDAAESESASRTGRTRFTVAMRGDSRVKRFTLQSDDSDDDTALAESDVVLDAPKRRLSGDGFAPTDALVERLCWVLFAAAAISNTAQMVKPTADDKPRTPTGTGGRPTVASRQYTTVAADTVAQYATRVANEMLKSYRERWKKR